MRWCSLVSNHRSLMHTTVFSLFFLVCLFFFLIVTEFKKYIRIDSPKSNHVKAGVNLKFAQKLSFLFSSEFAALGIKLCYGKIIFHLFSIFLPFWAILKFPLWLIAWLPWQREEHFLIFQLFMTCYSGNQAPNGQDLTRDTLFSLIWRVF